MITRIVLALCVCLVYTASAFSRPPTMTLQNNQFTNMVVAIHDSIAEDKTLIDKLKDKLTKASQTLFKATRQRAYFKDIVILLPSTWSDDSAYGTPSSESIYQADVIITDNFRRKRSDHTRSYRGCGQQGVHVLLNKEFLTLPRASPYFNSPEKYFVHAFAQFRWGVYQEYGEEGESPFYISLNTGRPEAIRCVYNMRGLVQKNDVNHTICYTAIDAHTGLYEDGCKWMPYPYRQRVKASMMDFQFINEIETFCDDNTTSRETIHNYEAPSKHNRLCDHRSVWDIIQNTNDFTGGINPAVTAIAASQLTPTFRILKATTRKRRAAIAIADSVKEREGFEKTLIDLGRLKRETDRHSVPMSIVYVKNEAILEHAVDTIDNIDVLRSELMSTNTRLPTCREMSQVKDDTADHKLICVDQSLDNNPDGITYGKTAGQTLLDKLRHAVLTDPASKQSVTVIKREDYLTCAGVNQTDTIHVDESLQQSNLHLIFHYEESLPVVTLQSPAGLLLTLQHADVHENLKEIAFIIRAQTGEWSFNIISRDNQTVSLMVTANAEGPDNLDIRLVLDRPEISLPYFRLFVDVTQFHHPVVGLNVTASIETPSGDRKWLQLLDNGVGADMLKDDGVYSRYFTQVREPGHYHVTTTVFGRKGQVYRKEEGFDDMFDDMFDDQMTELGLRDVQKYVKRSELAETIQRHIGGQSIYTANQEVNVSGRNDVIPPCKITDLSVQKHMLYRNQVILKFTAPGDDLDTNKVSWYEVYIGKNLESSDIPKFLAYTQTSVYKGQGQVLKKVYNSTAAAMETELVTCAYLRSKSSNTFVFGVVGVDEAGNKGKVSNIVTI